MGRWICRLCDRSDQLLDYDHRRPDRTAAWARRWWRGQLPAIGPCGGHVATASFEVIRCAAVIGLEPRSDITGARAARHEQRYHPECNDGLPRCCNTVLVM